MGHPVIEYMPEGARAYILPSKSGNGSAVDACISVKVRRSRQEIPAIGEVYRR